MNLSDTTDRHLYPVRMQDSGGCSSCREIIKAGEIVLRLNDGEYYPTLCLTCVRDELALAEMEVLGE